MQRRLIHILTAVVIGGLAIDYAIYQSRTRRAMAVVSALDGRAGSLMGWPLGKEYVIVFSLPLTERELERAAVLNTLAGRDYVAVVFQCDLTDEQLDSAKTALVDCVVRQEKSPSELQGVR